MRTQRRSLKGDRISLAAYLQKGGRAGRGGGGGGNGGADVTAGARFGPHGSAFRGHYSWSACVCA